MPSLPQWGLVAAWGAFQARRATEPSAPAGLCKKGGLSREQGVFAFLPYPCSPTSPGVSVPAYQGAAAEMPVPPPACKPGRRLLLSDQSVFARVLFDRFTKRALCLSYRQEKCRPSCHTS